jgi:hypothetical protein
MSGRVKIKQRVVRSTLANKDIMSMFDEATGQGGVTLHVAYPKYLNMQNQATRFLRLLTAVADSAVMGMFPDMRAHLVAYRDKLQKYSDETFSAPLLEKYVPATALGSEGYADVPEDVAKQFAAVFTAVKTSNIVNLIIVTCKNLTDHKVALSDASNLNSKFLTGPGMTFSPLAELGVVNFKKIFNDGRLSKEDRDYVMVVLHKMYTVGYDMYTAVSAPDVDVDEFVNVVMASINEIRGQVPRCDGAFDKIAESVSLLKGNFNGYHRESVASGNPTIIMENFVLDVAKKESKNSPQVAQQFRKIIGHYRKIASQHANDPRLRSVFSAVDDNFKELERRDRAATNNDDDSADSDGEDDGDDDAATHAATRAGGEGAAPPADEAGLFDALEQIGSQ